ncbi:17525_t:CDS:10 [Funneliformis geosporum]|nr:17525_t:CDS:10 [Funneliformis geosporum]
MLVYVLNIQGHPLMPCKPAKAKKLLKNKQAKIVKHEPFTIQLNFECENKVQDITLGTDPASKKGGLSAVSDKKELYSAEFQIRGNEVVKLLSERKMYRQNRRSRKTRYREARFLNRKKEDVVEINKFNIQKIKNPTIQGTDYQQGEQYGFENFRQYVLRRDKYKCQALKTCKSKGLEVHHLESRMTGGDAPNNLLTLCEKHHQEITDGERELKIKRGESFKDASYMNMMRLKLVSELKEEYENVQTTYGYITKSIREEHKLEKSHRNDALCIDNEVGWISGFGGRKDVYVKDIEHKPLLDKNDYESRPNQKQIKAVVNRFLEEINNALISGEELRLTGSFTLLTNFREEKEGRNPKNELLINDNYHNIQQVEIEYLKEDRGVFSESDNLKKYESLIEKVIDSIDSDRFLTQNDIAGFDVSGVASEVARKGYIFNPKCWECGGKIEVNSSDPKDGYVVKKFKHDVKGERKEVYYHESCIKEGGSWERFRDFVSKNQEKVIINPNKDGKKLRYFTLPLVEALKYSTKIKNNNDEVKCKECTEKIIRRRDLDRDLKLITDERIDAYLDANSINRLKGRDYKIPVPSQDTMGRRCSHCKTLISYYKMYMDDDTDCLECNDFYHQKITKRIDAKKNILCCELTYVLETQWKNAFQRYNFCKEKLLDSDKTAIAYYNYSLISEYNHNVLSYLKKNDSLNCAKCIDFLEILEKHKKDYGTSSDSEYYRNLALAYSLVDKQTDLTLDFKGDLSREKIIELSKSGEDSVVAFLKDINNSPCWKALGKVLALDLSGNSTTALYLVEEKLDKVQKYSFDSKIPSVHLSRIKKQISSLQPDLTLVIFKQGERYEKREECIALHQVHKEYKKANPLSEFVKQDFANRHEIDAYYLYRCYRDQVYEDNDGSGFNLETEIT